MAAATQSVARMGPVLLSRLSLSATITDPTATIIANDIGIANTASPNVTLGDAICSTCDLRFPDYDEQRQHYKSDYHRLNQQRKMKRLPIVTEDDFDNMSDVSSIEGSDSDSSEDQDLIDNGDDDASPRTSHNSAMVEFPLLPDSKKALLVYKSLLVPARTSTTPSELVIKLKHFQSCKYITLFMTGAGHFAGAVFDMATEKPFVHKTIHRYTTRRKQGGAQSANDKLKGNAHSAGAGLRRYNEMALEKDIQELIVAWKDQIQESSLVFLRASQSSRKAFFAITAILKPNDGRLRGYPFTTRRATFTELQRAYKELTMIRIADVTVNAEAIKLEHAQPVSNSSIAQPTPIPEQPQQQIDPILVKIIDFTRRGKNELLATHLDSNPSYATTKLHDSEGTSLLHIASSNNQPSTVELLLTKYNANPTIKNMRNLRSYDVAGDKETRNAFRRVMFKFPDAWDWKDTHVPSPLSPEMEEDQKAKEKAKKAAQREKEKAAKKTAAATASSSNSEVNGTSNATSSKSKSIVSKLSKSELEAVGMAPEARARLDREKRAMTAEARLRSQQNQCANCKKSLEGLIPFDKLQYRYCSTECIRAQHLLHM